ncbi:MAG TPA: RNA polymerase sigma factor [Terriglobia bacterium]|nr:RNA polymerase sigma factor [Terriglobia bacterium]
MSTWTEILQDPAGSLDSALPQQIESVDRALEREFDERLADCSALAYRVALSVLHSPADAEDVAQEAFIRAYRHRRELRDAEHFRAWLVRVTWRLAIDRQRSSSRRDRRELVAASDLPPAPSVEQTAVSREFQQRLDRAVEALPEKLRRVLVLAALEGYEMRETAVLLDLPEGTVRSRLHRARKILAEKLR